MTTDDFRQAAEVQIARLSEQGRTDEAFLWSMIVAQYEEALGGLEARLNEAGAEKRSARSVLDFLKTYAASVSISNPRAGAAVQRAVEIAEEMGV